MCINDQIFSNIMFIVSFLFGSIWILKFIPKNVVLVWLRKPIELIQLLHLIHELGRCAIFEKSSSFRILSFLKWSQKKLFNYGLKNVNSFYKQVAFFFWRKWCFFLANYSWSCWIEKNMYLTCSLWQRDFVGTNLSEKICVKKKKDIRHLPTDFIAWNLVWNLVWSNLDT